MTRPKLLLIFAALCMALMMRPAQAGAILDADPQSEFETESGYNGRYYGFFTFLAGKLYDSDYGCAIAGFPLPYLGPGQQVTNATVSFYLTQVNGSPTMNLQLYGLNRVSTTSPAPISADYYEGTNDTANTLLDATFATPKATANTLLTYSGANVTTFIQKQYANSAFSSLGDFAKNRYVFMRLSPDATDATSYQNYVFGNGRNPNRQLHPTLAITISGGLTATAGRLQFSFNLPQASITSAGVYNPSTGALIRTLWNSVRYEAGMNYGAWDGKDDSGNTVATGSNYQIKLINHNVTYTWDGTVGNTSANQAGPNVYRSNGPLRDMAYANGYMFYTTGYDELFDPYNKFAIGAPQTSLPATQFLVQDPYANPLFVAADATHSYWAKCLGGLTGWCDTYVFALNNADGSEYTFPKGTTPSGANQKYTSSCDFDGSANPDAASGLAVQQSGSYLFVSHGDKNIVRVFDKLQGTSIGSFTVASAGQLATTANGDVWVVSNTSSPAVSRYTFSGGSAKLVTTISGLVAPMGLGVSADDKEVLIADGGASQQVKAFDNTSGDSLWTYGLEGGMAVHGANVVNNSFDFGAQSYVAFQPDNTFWVGDPGNYRHMHFSYSGSTVTYIEQFGYVPLSYDVAIDGNTPTRVMNQFLEYTVNYSIPLGGTNGSWALTKNWAYGLPNDVNHNYSGFQNGVDSVETLSNGHVYALIKNFINGNFDLFELPATGFARATGYTFDGGSRIYPDGTLRFNINNGGTSMSFYSRPLTGFDAMNNPKWGSPALLATTAIGSTDPQSWVGTYPERTEVTSAGVVVDYDGNQGHTGYHLGGVASGGTAFQWRAQPSTTSAYKGWLPQDGTFDIGNGTQYAGDVAMAMGSNIVCGYHGEFWKNGQASQWKDWYENGLEVGEFGTYGNASFTCQTAVDGFAGNSYSPQLVKYNGQVYLYSNDENNHGGTIRWKINGWENIAQQAATGAVGGITSLSSGSSAPVVTVTSPTANGNYYNGRWITLSAEASSTSGAPITNVQFFDGTTSLGSVTTAPYVINYTGLGTGSHVITAKATDGDNRTTTSAAVNITVGADGTSTPPPAPTGLSTSDITSSSVTLNWTEPETSTTSSTTGQVLSFQFQSPTDPNSLKSTDIAGAPGYAVGNFNILSQTGTGTALMVFTNPVNNSGVVVPNLAMNTQCVVNGDLSSITKMTGTAYKIFSGEADTQYSTNWALSFYDIPYGVYDLVVYSQPDNINTGTQSTSITVNDNQYTTTVNQSFNTMPTTYTVSSIGFGSSTSVTNSNTIVIRGMTASSFRLQGKNIAAFQIVQRPYDQGIATSYSIERSTSGGSYTQVGTANGAALSYIDSTVDGGTSYTYRIQAIDTYGTSPVSNTASATTTGTATASSGTSSGSTSSGSTSSGSTSSGSTSSGSTSSGSTSSGSTSSGSTSSGSTSSGSTSTGSTSTGSTSSGSTSSGTKSGSTSSGSTSTGSTSSGSTSSGSTSSGTTTTTQTGFQKWQAKYFTTAQLADDSISGPSADPYGSGVPNLLAYALQLNPATARPTDVPHAEIVSGHLTMSYFHPSAMTDIVYTLEVSTDLITWNSGTGYTTVVDAVTNSTGTTFTIADALPASSQKHFMRLRVSQN